MNTRSTISSNVEYLLIKNSFGAMVLQLTRAGNREKLYMLHLHFLRNRETGIQSLYIETVTPKKGALLTSQNTVWSNAGSARVFFYICRKIYDSCLQSALQAIKDCVKLWLVLLQFLPRFSIAP